jgi:2-octaprenyl-6-methoxyphenol hydroxylase
MAAMDNPGGLVLVPAAMERFDVIISGGGLNGTALAIALAQAGLGVAIVDPRPEAATPERPGGDGHETAGRGDAGRAYALAAASKRMLDALAVWPLVAREAQPILGIRTSDGRPGEGASPLHMSFDHGEIEEGPMGFMLEDRPLAAALRHVVAAQSVAAIAGDAVADHAAGPGGVTVTLRSGRRIAAALLVAAEGRGSATARRAGIVWRGWSYGQTALVATVAHERPHGGVAHQLFLPGGPLAILPLTRQRASIVWTERDPLGAAAAALPDAAFMAALRPRFGDFLGEITLAGPRHAYPLALALAEDYVAPRLALVGDAAHGVHPIAGQGLNLGLRDVAALAEVLAEARRRGEDIGAPDVLLRYRRWRRFDATALALGMDAVNRLFSNDLPPLRLMRDLGMAAIDRLPGLRRAFIREAAGLSGDQPRLLAGRAL